MFIGRRPLYPIFCIQVLPNNATKNVVCMAIILKSRGFRREYFSPSWISARQLFILGEAGDQPYRSEISRSLTFLFELTVLKTSQTSSSSASLESFLSKKEGVIIIFCFPKPPTGKNSSSSFLYISSGYLESTKLIASSSVLKNRLIQVIGSPNVSPLDASSETGDFSNLTS